MPPTSVVSTCTKKKLDARLTLSFLRSFRARNFIRSSQTACPTSRLVLCGECDEHTRASANGAPRASLRAFALADDPDATAPDAFGARYPADVRSASRHPFREGLYLYPREPGALPQGSKEFRQKSEGSGDGQGSGGAEDETNPKDGARSPFRADPRGSRPGSGGAKSAGGGGGGSRLAATHALGSRPVAVGPDAVLSGMHGQANPAMMAPFPPSLAGYPGGGGGVPPYHAQGEWQDLLRQGSVGDGALPLGARFFPHAPGNAGVPGASGPGLHGLNRLGSHSSNGSDPIGMYMNFDGNAMGSNPVGSGSGGDLAGQAGGGGSNGSPAREMGSHQEVTSDVASMWMYPFGGGGGMPGYVGNGGGYPGQNRGGNNAHPVAFPSLGVSGPFAPFAPSEGYGAPRYGAMQQTSPYFAEPMHPSFAPNSNGSYPAMQQQPAMHDQIHRVGAAPPRPPAAHAASPYQHTAGGATTMLPREAPAPPSSGAVSNGDLPSAGPAAAAHYPRGPDPRGGVPASSWSTEATHAAQYGYGPGAFYDGGAPPVAGVIGARGAMGASQPGPLGSGLVRMERNSQGSIGGSGGSGGGGVSGGGGSVVAVSALMHRGPYGFGSHEFLVGARGRSSPGGSDAEDAARAGGLHGSHGAVDPNDEIRAAAGSMAPGTKAREEMLVRYHKKRKERHFKKKIRYASRKVRADNRVRIKGRFARADAPLGAIDKSSAKNHPDVKGETREEADEERLVRDESDARDERETDAGDSDSDSEAEDDEPAPVGKRTRRGVHAVSKGLPKSAPKVMTGVSELATPDVPPGACA